MMGRFPWSRLPPAPTTVMIFPPWVFLELSECGEDIFDGVGRVGVVDDSVDVPFGGRGDGLKSPSDRREQTDSP